MRTCLRSPGPEVDNEGVFVIQNKVASRISRGPRRKTARRAKSIQKNIMDGIGQLEGAIKVLRARGDDLSRRWHACRNRSAGVGWPSRAAQSTRESCRGRSGHCPDLRYARKVDWEAVFFSLGKVFLSTRYYCHVLDLQELAAADRTLEAPPSSFGRLAPSPRGGNAQEQDCIATISFRRR